MGTANTDTGLPSPAEGTSSNARRSTTQNGLGDARRTNRIAASSSEWVPAGGKNFRMGAAETTHLAAARAGPEDPTKMSAFEALQYRSASNGCLLCLLCTRRSALRQKETPSTRKRRAVLKQGEKFRNSFEAGKKGSQGQPLRPPETQGGHVARRKLHVERELTSVGVPGLVRRHFRIRKSDNGIREQAANKRRINTHMVAGTQMGTTWCGCHRASDRVSRPVVGLGLAAMTGF